MKKSSKRLTALTGLLLLSLLVVSSVFAATPTLLLTVNPAPPGGTTTATVAISDMTDVESFTLKLDFSSGTSLILPAAGWFARGTAFPSALFGSSSPVELNSPYESAARTKVFMDGFRPSGTFGAIGSVTFDVSAATLNGASQVLTLTGEYYAKSTLSAVTFVPVNATFTADTLPHITASPAAFNYNSISVEQTALQTFTISNTGLANLSISSVTISGIDQAEFLKTEDSCNGKSVVAGATCTVKVEFDPTTLGEKNAVLAISSNATNATALNIALSGTAITAGFSDLVNISTLPNGAVTNNKTLNISGTLYNANAIAGLSINDNPVTITNGSFSYAVTLQEGDNFITLVTTDILSNTTTDIRTITLDQSSPELTVAAPVDNSATATSQITIAGACGDAASVTVKINDSTPQSAVITSDSYNLTAPLTEGQNTLTVTATDAVGNSSSVARTVLYDATAPALAITIPVADVTVSTMPYTISGTVDDALTDVTLTMTVNGQTVAPAINGADFTYQLNSQQGGTYQIVVTAKDLLENTATVSRNVIFSPYGDIDNDGVTTSTDAMFALKMSIGLKTVDLKADLAPLVNGVPAPNGRVTAADALVILRKSVDLW